MIFNSGGKILKNFVFMAGEEQIEIVDTYQYLGIKLKSSGSMKVATDELYAKANRAWFSISNVLYQHKKLAVHKALQLFDSLIRPILARAAALQSVADRRLTGNDVVATISAIIFFSPFFSPFSVATFSHRRSARIKNFV